MPQWEYRKLECGDHDLEALAAAGLDGWELVYVADNFAYLKREISAPGPPSGNPAPSADGQGEVPN